MLINLKTKIVAYRKDTTMQPNLTILNPQIYEITNLCSLPIVIKYYYWEHYSTHQSDDFRQVLCLIHKLLRNARLIDCAFQERFGIE